MRAVSIARAGGPEVLEIGDRTCPAPRAGEVLIEVFAAGVNGHDVHQRHLGGHPINPGETDLPGLEVAGIVAATGDDVSDFEVGDRVCALLRGGGYAEFAVAPTEQCLKVPDRISLIEAAALPETFYTVWSNVFVEASLMPGERFLMNGGTSGIGVAAIQMAALLGSEVYATARGREKCALCVSLGAKVAIDYTTQVFDTAILDLTGGEGVDVILDIVAGDYLPRDIKLLRMDGRLVVIGGARGMRAEIDFGPVARKRLRITGSTLRPRSLEYKARLTADIRQRIWPFVENGRFRIVVHSTFPLEEAHRAHALMEGRGHIGKIMLEVKKETRT